MIAILFSWFFWPFLYALPRLRQMPEKPSRLLLIQTAKIGDMVAMTPLISGLRKQFPDAALYVLVQPIAEAVIRHRKDIDMIWTVDPKKRRWVEGLRFAQQLWKAKIDTTICVTPNRDYLLFPFWCGVRRRLSLFPPNPSRSYRWTRLFQTDVEIRQPKRMAIESAWSLLGFLGISGSLPLPNVPTPEQAERAFKALPFVTLQRPWIGIGVSSANKMKALGEELLIALCTQLLNETSATLLLLGSQEDKSSAEAVCRSIHNERLIDGTHPMPLEELPALLKELSVFVGVDSGLTYMADACGIPVVVLTGPTDADDQRPRGGDAIIIRSNVACAPCSRTFRTLYQCALPRRICLDRALIQTAAEATVQLLHQAINRQGKQHCSDADCGKT